MADLTDEHDVDPPGTATRVSEAAEGTPGWVRRAAWKASWSFVAAVLLALAALWFLVKAQTLVGYLVLSALLSLALEPAVIWLHEKRGWRRGSATGLILVSVLAFFVFFAVMLVPILAEGVEQIVDVVPEYIDDLNDFAMDNLGTTAVSESSADQSQEALDGAVQYLGDQSAELLGVVGGLIGGIFAAFTVGMFTFYFTANGPQVRRAILSRMPPERQRHALWAWHVAIEKTGGYLYSRGLLALISAGLMFVVLSILDVPFALPIALFQGVVAAFIPIVGTYIAGAVPVIVALGSVGLVPALIVLAEVLIYQQVENYYLSPRISQKTMELNPGVAFAAAMAGGAVGGFVGAFFALPIAAVIQSFIANYSRSYDVVDSDLTRLQEPKKVQPRRRRRRIKARAAD